MSSESDIEEARRLERAQQRPGFKKANPSRSSNRPTEQSEETERSPDSQINVIRVQREQALLDNQQQDVRMRKHLGYGAMTVVAVQMVAANVFFGWYMVAADAKPQPEVMLGWMGMTVVQVIGVILVVTRNLFPPQKPHGKSDSSTEC